MPGADLPVTFPSGETRNVNMIVLLVEVQNAEWHAKYGAAMPGVNRLPNVTIKNFREKYELDWFASEVFPKGIRTWDQCAQAMRHFYNVCTEHIEASR
jgi:hypothetical protein